MRTSRLTCSILFAGPVAAAALMGVVGEAAASRTGARSRVGEIAFLRSVVGAGPAGLFVIGAEGKGLRRLSPSGLDVDSFEWSPDGSRIAYLDSGGALRLVRPDGTGRELLAGNSPFRNPWFLSWSPDGKAIALEFHDPVTTPLPRWHHRIVVVSTGGGTLLRLPSGDDAQDIAWSPAGGEIVYESGSGRLRIIATDGDKPRPFFPTPQTQGFGLPMWSPDGTHVGFVGSVRDGRHPTASEHYDAIYVADADGRNFHVLTSHAYNEYGFAWSPDGRSILYGRAHRGGIYVIGVDGRHNHRLTTDWPTPTEFPTLTWAPDGRSVAYATDRTGNGDIYVIGADGRNKVRLTSSPAADVAPSWQPQPAYSAR
jgi:TolB protein